ncbi:MAG: peptidoglycan-associated lipoprotein Pal [Nitrosomonadales bacterium]|nr:peptidoglycan-associated lipoprotein Pal [Nitrosomonadales bacterium]
MKKIALSALLVSLLSACGTVKNGPTTTTFTGLDSANATAAPASAAASTPSSAVKQVEADALDDPKGALASRSVYYPFDVDVVQAADRPLVAAHAKYLSEHPARQVKLEGNADERGSNEYNLALGQRRADGVKKLLVVGGAKDGQLSTASYGEEKPKAAGHNEAAWQQNRRTDIKYQGK